MKFLKYILMTFLVVGGLSMTAFAQKDKNPPKKDPPPVINPGSKNPPPPPKKKPGEFASIIWVREDQA